MRYLPFAALAAAAASSVFAVLAGHHKKTPKAKEQAKEMLPISRVVMYQSGIGYVERCAQIATDKLILRIRPDQINDILKSLTIIDRGNGRPVSISLPVDKDTLDSLAQIPEQIKDGGVRSLLNAFRGANVKIKTMCCAYEGRIVGVDERDSETNLQVSVNSSNSSSEDTVTLLTSNNVLHVIRLSEIRSVALYDQSLTDGLDKSLNISLNEGNWKQLELTIQLDSSEPREIALSYLVAMPTWKPAYRLVLKDDDKAILQGWAVVSNVTGADWNNIAFSLVSGQPMSFTYDLYTPQFLKRPDLSGLAEQRAAAPEVINSGYGAPMPNQMRAMKMAAPANMAMMGGAAPGFGAMPGAMEQARYCDLDMDECSACNEYAINDDEMANSFVPQAEKSQIGSFDEYKLASKLTLPDGNTALVNLIHHEIFAKDTRLIQATDNSFDSFRRGWRQTKSFQTIELRNDTGLALNAGPITLYKDSAVIGEGYLSRTEKDATAYITYANEGRLAVDVTDRSKTRAFRLDAVKHGYVTFTTIDTNTLVFQFESHIEHDITALLQLRRDSDLTPINFPENVVKSEDKYTIPVLVKANGNQQITLTMQRLSESSSSIQPLHANALHAIRIALKEGKIPQDAQADFNQFLDDLEQQEQIRSKTGSLQNRKAEIEKDQSALTKNLTGLKDIESEDAAELKNQILKRQQANELALVEITKELYALQSQKEEIDLRLQTTGKKLKYLRAIDDDNRE